VSAGPRTVRLDDDRSMADLAAYLRRGARADPDGAARLLEVRAASGIALAVYVSRSMAGRGRRSWGCEPSPWRARVARPGRCWTSSSPSRR